MKFKEAYLYLFFFISNMFGRELISTNLIGIANIRYYHIFFITFTLLNYNLFLREFPNKKLFYSILLLSIIPFYLGIKQGNEGVFNFLIVNFSFLFYLWGYFYLDTTYKIDKYIKFLVLCFILKLVYTEVLFQLEDKSILFSLTPLLGAGGIRQSSDTLNSLAVISFLYFIFKKNQKNRVLINSLILFVIYRYEVRGSFLALLIVLLYYILKYKSSFISKLFLANYKIVIILILAMLYIIILNLNEFKEFVLRFSETNYDPRGTFIWRLSIWYDNLVSAINNGNLLVSVSGMTIDYNLTRYLGGWGYVNPHNSFIFILINYGLIYLMLYLVIPFKLLFTKIKYSQNIEIKILVTLIIVMYLGLSLTTATFELPYQGSTFWFLVGASFNLINRKKYA